ncbi:MAG: RNA polymerase subunit sigma [Mesorhizobium sp. SCN 65-20]|nr:MAG: RNA polymerase subunit sigma [Mesorhizobium sp. SCN 65-20]
MRPLALRHPIDHEAARDDELVALARQADEAAIRALIKRNNQRLFRVARAVVRDDAEAEDVVQETYVRAFTRLDGFRGDAMFSTWLTRIALNEALARVRRKRPVSLPLETATELEGGQIVMFPTPPTSGADAEAGRSQVRQMLEEAMDELPQAFRIVFVLRDVEELSVEETAAQLSIKPETVKTRLFRARRLMRSAIERRVSAGFAELFPFMGVRCERMADRVIERLRRA